jgi:hypothetical protein
VGYAVCRINVDARDMRMVTQPPFQELNARGTAAPSDRDAERFYVVASLRRVNGWCMCHRINQAPAQVRL